jgi:hypothetical protein
MNDIKRAEVQDIINRGGVKNCDRSGIEDG